MLVLEIISTVSSVGSFIVAIIALKQIKTIDKSINKTVLKGNSVQKQKISRIKSRGDINVAGDSMIIKK